jgi:regulator of sigma E protease
MTIIIFLIVLSILVVIHELGHFFTARIFGVKAIEFGLGFPPRAVGMVKEGKKWKKVSANDKAEYKRTIWSLNWLPFGGFVKLKGEQEDGMHDKDSLLAKPIWRRAIIMAGGVCMNWIFAVVLLTIVFIAGMPAALEDAPAGASIKDKSIMITAVLPDSPAQTAGLQPGDTILSVDKQTPQNEKQVREWIGESGVTPLSLKIKRDNTDLEVTATPREIKELGKTGLGIGLADVGFVSLSPVKALLQSVVTTGRLTKAVIYAFGGLFRDLVVTHRVSSDVSGPVGIAVLTGQVARQGIVPLLQFAAILSINLAVVNFLPIPALDGGRVFFLAIEKVRRKPMSQKLEMGIHNVAFLLLIMLIILVTARDLFRYGGAILGGLKGLVGI